MPRPEARGLHSDSNRSLLPGHVLCADDHCPQTEIIGGSGLERLQSLGTPLNRQLVHGRLPDPESCRANRAKSEEHILNWNQVTASCEVTPDEPCETVENLRPAREDIDGVSSYSRPETFRVFLQA